MNSYTNSYEYVCWSVPTNAFPTMSFYSSNPSVFQVYGQGNCMIFTGGMTGSATLIAEITNDCGTSTYYFPVSIENCPPGDPGCIGTIAFSLYPNPASTYLEVEPDDNLYSNDAKEQGYEVRIFDNFNQEKIHKKSRSKYEKMTLDVSSPPRGIYVVQIYLGNQVVRKRLEIVR